MKNAIAISMVVVLMILAGCGFPATRKAEETEVVTFVEEFGSKLQLVSLLSPTVADDIRTVYAPYVSPQLLDQWAADPAQAPGRLTSSPWPDRIEVSEVTSVAAGKYSVTGNIIEVTSAEVGSDVAANTIPIQLTVQKSGEQWLITEFAQATAR